MNWGHVVRNTVIAIGITFVTAVGVYLATRFLQSVLKAQARTCEAAWLLLLLFGGSDRGRR